MTTDELRAQAIELLREHTRQSGYIAYHMPRYEALVERLCIHHRGGPILDIGPSLMTRAIAVLTGNSVDTLGLQQDTPPTTGTGRHWSFDLNRCQEEPQWRRDIPEYATIVMAEVIEHVHTAPSLVLRFLRTLLAPDGCLIVQTPNACALHKRLYMLMGRNPFEEFREDISSPGHYREYTRAEIDRLASRTGFDLLHIGYGSYFDYRYRSHASGTAPRPSRIGAWINAGYKIVPRSMRPGITCVLRRTD